MLTPASRLACLAALGLGGWFARCADAEPETEPAAVAAVVADWKTEEVTLRAEFAGVTEAGTPLTLVFDGDRPAPTSVQVRRTAGTIEVRGPARDVVRALVPGTRSLRVRVGTASYRIDLPPLDIARFEKSRDATAENAIVVSFTVPALLPGAKLHVAETSEAQPRPRAVPVTADGGNVRLVAPLPEGTPPVLKVRLPAGGEAVEEVHYAFTVVNPDGSRSQTLRFTMKGNDLDATPKTLAAARPLPVDDWAEAPACVLEKGEDAAKATTAAGLVPVFVDLAESRELTADEAKGETVLRQGVAPGGKIRKGEVLLLLVREAPTPPASDKPIAEWAVDPGADLGFIDPGTGGSLESPGGLGSRGKRDDRLAPGDQSIEPPEEARLLVPPAGVSLDPSRSEEADFRAGVLRSVVDTVARTPEGRDAGGALGKAVQQSVEKAEKPLIEYLVEGGSVEKTPVEPILDSVTTALGVKLDAAGRTAALGAWRAAHRGMAPAQLDRNRNRQIADDVAAWFVAWLWQRGQFDPCTLLRLSLDSSGRGTATFPKQPIPADWVKQALDKPLNPNPGTNPNTNTNPKPTPKPVTIPTAPHLKTGTSNPDVVRVPAVKEDDNARSYVDKLHALGLKFRAESKGVFGLDFVVGTSPPENRWVAVGSVVTVKVRHRTPDLVGKSVKDAKTELDKRGLGLEPTLVGFKAKPEDVIAEQKPPAGDPIGSGEVVLVRLKRPVPKVAGKSVRDAATTLREAGFGCYHLPDVAAYDTALETNPKEGEVAVIGSEVKVTIRRPIPDVTGKPSEEARRIIREHGYGLGNAKDFEGLTRSWVIKQDLPGGKILKLAPDFDVSKIVMTLTPGVKVPRLKDSTLESAVATLKDARLQADYKNQFDKGLPVQVTAQDPAADKLVEVNSKVTLTLALAGREVPYVTGFPVARAKSAIESKGLKWEFEPKELESDFVYSQNPESGSILKPEVKMKLRPGFRVPELIGVSEADVLTKMNAVGAKLATQPKEVTEDTDNPDLGGKAVVKEQTPAAGELVPRGEKLTLTILRYRYKEAGVEVPNFIGRTTEEAEELARGKVQLERTIVTELTEDASKAGKTIVTDQDTAAGTRVEQGYRVVIRLTRYQMTERPELVSVPDFRGKTQQQAEVEASDKVNVVSDGIHAEVTENVALVGKTLVTGQTPPAGKQVPQGTSVALSYTRYIEKDRPQPNLVLVPRLGGMDQPTAKAALERAGLRMQAESARDVPTRDRTMLDRVLAVGSRPGENAVARQGDTVTVYFARYVAPANPPQRPLTTYGNAVMTDRVNQMTPQRCVLSPDRKTAEVVFVFAQLGTKPTQKNRTIPGTYTETVNGPGGEKLLTYSFDNGAIMLRIPADGNGNGQWKRAPNNNWQSVDTIRKQPLRFSTQAGK